MTIRILATSVALFALMAPVLATEQVKVGFIGSLSGPLGPVGSEMKRGFDTAMEQLDNKIGGIPALVTVFDDKAVPANAVQGASKFIDNDKVDFVTGVNASNISVTIAKTISDAGIPILGAIAGPVQWAGKGCLENAYFVGFQNDQWPEGMGKYMTDSGIKRAYFIGLDYQAGWDFVAAARRAYRGEVAGQIFTPLTQLDFSAEFAQIRAAKPDGIFAFYVGGPSVAFVKQYAQSGLKAEIPLHGTDGISDELSFAAQGDAALGIKVSSNWSYALDNPANKKFVEAFRAKYKRNPGVYAATQYDAVMLMDSAVRSLKGDLSDKNGLRAALRKADFQSVRGFFQFNNNHFPIQNIYIQEVGKSAQSTTTLLLKGTAAEKVRDLYHQECPMKW
jgi:branched-chain amino acid transport system substrate-binding protein